MFDEASEINDGMWRVDFLSRVTGEVKGTQKKKKTNF